jgi:hypothetical protein
MFCVTTLTTIVFVVTVTLELNLAVRAWLPVALVSAHCPDAWIRFHEYICHIAWFEIELKLKG